jgi:hypothetical protein
MAAVRVRPWQTTTYVSVLASVVWITSDRLHVAPDGEAATNSRLSSDPSQHHALIGNLTLHIAGAMGGGPCLPMILRKSNGISRSRI